MRPYMSPQGKTSVTNPEMMIPGALVSSAGNYWILREKIGEQWYGYLLGEDRQKEIADVDFVLHRNPVPPYCLICEPGEPSWKKDKKIGQGN